MSRSSHHGCGKTCGVCKPHKKWKSNSLASAKPSVQRRRTELSDHEEEIALRALNAELKDLVPCANCKEFAEWFGPSVDYCDICIPRGECSCTTDENGNQERDEQGRLLPCCDFIWIGISS